MSSTESANTSAPPQNAAMEKLSAEELAHMADATLLVVDDNQQNLELLQAYLEPLGCRIMTATDGLEALKAVDTETPDLILLDVMMPRMSGFEVCKKLKADPATRAIPIIMVTALNEVGDIERGVESGTDDFLSKPVNKLVLLTRVRNLLRIHQLKRELDNATGRSGQDEANGPANDNGAAGH